MKRFRFSSLMLVLGLLSGGVGALLYFALSRRSCPWQ